ncbi:hypothetical protein KDA_45550 [Dictyobacter alpinus]|uniref:Uncharacterized protein n=1 Tax=Dictyobacter alpinus TaxID=2014873 RepID=A0A402BCD4_9CHLR|nr:hypothetical protein [Dictyobacter alpinus]GCE29071.1 hypothetical protein KDA_45550 [Dictyobacter alpinus]
MTGDQTPVASANLSELSDLCTPWCIHVVATLRIADHIEASTTNIKTLAEKAECNDESEEFLFHHCSKFDTHPILAISFF